MLINVIFHGARGLRSCFPSRRNEFYSMRNAVLFPSRNRRAVRRNFTAAATARARATVFIFSPRDLRVLSFCRCINHKSALRLTFAYPRAYIHPGNNSRSCASCRFSSLLADSRIGFRCHIAFRYLFRREDPGSYAAHRTNTGGSEEEKEKRARDGGGAERRRDVERNFASRVAISPPSF